MTKHFPGGGPQKDGEDPHFPYGKDQVYPGGKFELPPASRSRRRSTPERRRSCRTTGVPVGTELEEVGFGFNRDVITGLLRERYGFDGVVCTDWGARHGRDAPGRLGVRGEVLGRRGAEHRRSGC